MKKPLKITLIALLCLAILGGLIFAGFNIFGYKGQSINDLKSENQGQNQVATDNGKDISEYSPQECLYILSGKMKDISYHASVNGEVTTSLGGLTKQTVTGDKYLNNGRALYQTKSTSVFVNVAKKTYIESDGTVNVFDAKNIDNDTWQDTPTHYQDLNLYISDYGVDYRNVSNYVLNDQTVLSAKKIATDNGTYKFEYIISPDKATIGYKLNMIKMGGLNSAPEFSYCKLTVVMTDDFMPVSVTTYDEYKVAYFGLSLNCTSIITTAYDNVNSNIIIP